MRKVRKTLSVRSAFEESRNGIDELTLEDLKVNEVKSKSTIRWVSILISRFRVRINFELFGEILFEFF